MHIGKYMNVQDLQVLAAKYWGEYMEHKNISCEDAACYESYISFPTPIKIVWDGCNKVYCCLQQHRKQLKLRSTRCNYPKFRKLFLAYQKQRKKTKRQEKKLLKTLLKFLLRLLNLYNNLVVEKIAFPLIKKGV